MLWFMRQWIYLSSSSKEAAMSRRTWDSRCLLLFCQITCGLVGMNSNAIASVCGGSGACNAPTGIRPVFGDSCTLPTTIIGTPIGPLLSNPGGYSLTLKKSNGQFTPAGTEIWLSYFGENSTLALDGVGE